MNIVPFTAESRRFNVASVTYSIFTGEREEIGYFDGETLADIASRIDLPEDIKRECLICRIGEHTWPHALWPYIRPKPYLPVIPCFTVFPARHGGVAGTLFAAAAAAAIVASFFIPGGPIVAFAVRTAATLALSYALQGFRKLPAGLQSAYAADTTNIGSASGPGMVTPNTPRMRVCGRRRVEPQVVHAFRTWVGDDELYSAVVELAGWHEIEDGSIKSGDDVLDPTADESIQVETYDGAPILSSVPQISWITDTQFDADPEILLSEVEIDEDFDPSPYKGTQVKSPTADNLPKYHRVVTKTSNRAMVGYQFVQGLGHSISPNIVGVWFRIRFRPLGTAVWRNLPDLLYVHRSAKSVRAAIVLRFGESPNADAGNDWENDSGKSIKGWKLAHPVVVGSDAFLTPTGGNGYEEWIWSEKQLEVFLPASEAGKYEIETKRSWPLDMQHHDDATFTYTWTYDDGGPLEEEVNTRNFFGAETINGVDVIPVLPDNFIDDCRVVLVKSIQDGYPFNDHIGNPKMRIAVQVKNRALSTINCIVTSMAPTLARVDGVAQVGPHAATRNPAALFWDVLTGIHNAHPYGAVGGPDASTDRVLLEELTDWYLECAKQGWKADFIAENTSQPEVLEKLCYAGFAAPRHGWQIGAVMDRVRTDAARGTITARNAADFAWDKAFDEKPQALRVTFPEEDNNFAEREIVVYADGFNGDGSDGLAIADIYETRSCEQITRETQVRARYLHDLRFMRARGMPVTCTVGQEGFEYRQGDRLWVQIPSLAYYGGEGRIKSIDTGGGLVTGFVLDEFLRYGFDNSSDWWTIEDLWGEADLWGSELPPSIRVRLKDGSTRFFEIDEGASSGNHAVLASPFTIDPRIIVGAMCVIGRLAVEARDMLLQRVAPGSRGGNTFSLMFLDYAPAKMFPDFNAFTDPDDETLTDPDSETLTDLAA